MAHVKVVDRWEEGTPTPVPADPKVRAHPGGGELDPLFTAVGVDGYLSVTVQHSDDDRSALITSASLASDHVSLFGPGEDGVIPIVASKKGAAWDTTNNDLGFTVNSHTLRISCTREKTEYIKKLVFDHWPASRRQAKVNEALSMVGKLWNLTYVVRVGRYFMWRLLRLTGLHDSQDEKNHNHTVSSSHRSPIL